MKKFPVVVNKSSPILRILDVCNQFLFQIGQGFMEGFLKIRTVPANQDWCVYSRLEAFGRLLSVSLSN